MLLIKWKRMRLTGIAIPRPLLVLSENDRYSKHGEKYV